MANKIKTSLCFGGGILALLICLAVGLLIFVEPSAYRTRLETAATDALGMEVRIAGNLALDLWSGLQLSLADVHLAQQGAEVARIEKVSLGIEFLPLLRKQFRIKTLALQRPSITIERDQAGKFNFDRTQPNGDTEATLGWRQISLTDGTLIFADQQSGARFEAAGCNFQVSQLQPSDLQISKLLKNFSGTVELACAAIRSQDLTLSELHIVARGKDGIIELQPATMQVFSARGSGNLHADFSGPVPIYDLHFALPALRIEEFFKLLSPQQVATGVINFTADLSTQGKTLDEIRQAVSGAASLRGEQIMLLGRDLDEQFSDFESSQNFNLVDVGVVLFAGPLGLLVTKGYNFASNLQESGGSSAIHTLISDWQINNGVAQAQDVALATGKHRVALQGGLDLVNETFNDLTLALIDADGCTKVRQSIQGSFRDPQVEKPNFIKALAGPVVNVLKLGGELLPGGACEPFYSGAVAAPE